MKERQEKEEQRLLEISKSLEKGVSVKVRPAHRPEQIVSTKKTTQKKKKPQSDPKPGTSTEDQ